MSKKKVSINTIPTRDSSYFKLTAANGQRASLYIEWVFVEISFALDDRLRPRKSFTNTKTQISHFASSNDSRSGSLNRRSLLLTELSLCRNSPGRAVPRNRGSWKKLD